MMRKVLFVGAALLAISLTGCDLYYGGDRDSNCEFWGCEDEAWPTGPVAPGDSCTSNFQCAAGCFCEGVTENSEGTCTETGFCERSSDCANNMVCDDRATCIPDNDNCRDGVCPDSCLEIGCPDGAICDQATGQCTPADGCVTESDCGPGFSCAPDGTCVPQECNGDDDCLEGCFCNGDSVCEETGFCNVDEDCMQECDPAGNNCSPMECDTDRNTCVPGAPEPPPLAACNGEITCDDGAPTCGAGEAAEIANGCYTGNCFAIGQCDGDPLARCDELADSESCDARSDCWSRWIGTDCTCDGVPCNCGDSPGACICSNWNFSCRSN